MYLLAFGEPAFVQVTPRLYFGRRLTARESAAIAWVSVLDLAAEFTESKPLRQMGLERLRSLRPSVGLHPEQFERLRSFEPQTGDPNCGNKPIAPAADQASSLS